MGEWGKPQRLTSYLGQCRQLAPTAPLLKAGGGAFRPKALGLGGNQRNPLGVGAGNGATLDMLKHTYSLWENKLPCGLQREQGRWVVLLVYVSR